MKTETERRASVLNTDAATAADGPVPSRPVPSPVPTRAVVRVTMEQAREAAWSQMMEDGTQLSYTDARRLEEVVSLLTEIYMMPPYSEMIFNGIKVGMDMVTDVFRHLTAEMALYVLDRIRDQTVRYSRRSLLRAMLYNEVFEHESHIAQEAEALTGHGGGWRQ